MSRKASTCGAGAPPFAASTVSSSKKPHPFFPSLSIDRRIEPGLDRRPLELFVPVAIDHRS